MSKGRWLAMGMLIASILWISAIWAMPQIYMGQEFGSANLTKAQAIKVLESGIRIHTYYSKLPWRWQLVYGSERFDEHWIKAYKAIIKMLKE